MTRDLQTLQADTDLDAVMYLLKKWRDKSDNNELVQFEEMMIRLSVYIWSLQNERKTFDRVIDDLRSEKHRIIDRARRAEKKLEDYEKKVSGKNDSYSS